VAEAGAWLLFAVPMGLYVLWPHPRRPQPVAAEMEAAT
jgi:hypothetical protein